MTDFCSDAIGLLWVPDEGEAMRIGPKLTADNYDEPADVVVRENGFLSACGGSGIQIAEVTFK